MNEDRRSHIKQHVNKRLIFSVRLLGIVFLGLFGTAVVDIVRDRLNPFYPLVALLLSGVAGIVFSRIRRISWDESTAKVVARTDIYGVLILIVYIVLDLNRKKLRSHFFEGQLLSVVSLSVLAGLMYGRFLGMRNGIRNILRATTNHPKS